MSENLFSSQNSLSHAFQNAVGPIEYGFTNDFMFRTLLQQNNYVLKGLICSLLHLEADEVTSVEITNPILPGDVVYMKEFILDIQVALNGNTLINLEMQVVSQRPRCKQRSIKLATLQSSGVFDPRGIRQISVQARLLGSLLAGINRTGLSVL